MRAPERQLEPEWLDELPAEDPRAVRSRRDLRVLNRIMGHAGTIAGVLRARLRSRTPRIAELGAGDGTLLARVAAKLGWSEGSELALVDRQPVVSQGTRAQYDALGCRVSVHCADVFEWLEGGAQRFDAIVANLFLHHFDAEQLRRMFALSAARASLFVACEPPRGHFSLYGSRMLGLIGCNDVTRHDAVLSVRAGFAGQELSDLWPDATRWVLEERGAGPFSHLFVASSRGKP